MTALHGFLGAPHDWDGILGDAWAKPNWLTLFAWGSPLPSGGEGSGVRGIGLGPRPTSAQEEGTSRDLGASAVLPNERIRPSPSGEGEGLEIVASELNRRNAPGDVLLGYSMGGRIALHMLLREPRRWRRAIVVSASPGLADDAERAPRLKADAAWAARFLHDDWDATVAAWNAQGVFAHDPPDRLPRPEADYDRRALAAALVEGSVARQRDLRTELAALDLPILWIAGAKDPKYAALARECAALNPRFEARVLDAGHRVPWGAPDAFRAAVDEFTKIKP